MIGSKTALTVGSITVALLFGGGLYLYMNFSSIAKRLAEHVATETLGVDVSIGAVDVSLQDKRVNVTNIRIANPSGYKNSKALTIGEVSIQANALSQELLDFSNASVKDLHVNLEVTPEGTNLTDIQKNIKVPGRADKAEEDKKALTKVILENFIAEGGTITPSISMLETQPKTLEIPTIHLKGIGKAENGVLAREAVSQIFQAVAQSSIRAAQQEGLLDSLNSDALKEMGLSPLQNFKDTVKEKAGSVGDKIKGLFQ
ncbi:MAG: hypothetical protein LRY36_01865 [Alphaproteobacteria bacterium]|nr:hypothetical protein [Alphaproteobacteria bacterium]